MVDIINTNKELLAEFMKCIFSGMFIAMASQMYVNLNGGLVGAMVFSCGLLLVLNTKCPLFTGKVGFLEFNDKVDNVANAIWGLILILMGNLIGCCAIDNLTKVNTEFSNTLILNKLSIPLNITFINAVLCGILIYIAVLMHHKNKDYMVIVCVMTFILIGAEHCIADWSYFLFSDCPLNKFEVLRFMMVVILGNSLGSIFAKYTFKWGTK